MTTTTNTTDQLNKRQLRTFRDACEHATLWGHYEVKDLNVTSFDDGNDVYVSIEVGIPNDEGTMAEYICRSAYGFFIGERGGLYVYRNAGRKYLKGSLKEARSF